MALKTSEVELESSMLLVMDVSKLFSKDEWSVIQMAAKGPDDVPRAAIETLARKLGKDISKSAKVFNIRASGSLPVFMDRESLSVYIRGVGIQEWTELPK